MKKAFSFFFLLATMAQAQYLEKGDKLVNLSAGTAIIGSVEFALNDKFTIGPYVGTFSDDYKFNDGSTDKTRYLSFGGLINYHFYQAEKWDVYGTGILGYEKAKFSNTGTNSSVSINDEVFGIGVGARYHLTSNFSLKVDVGAGLWTGQFGLTYKL